MSAEKITGQLKHKKYSIEFKLSAIEEAEKLGNRPVADRLKINECSVRFKTKILLYNVGNRFLFLH